MSFHLTVTYLHSSPTSLVLLEVTPIIAITQKEQPTSSFNVALTHHRQLACLQCIPPDSVSGVIHLLQNARALKVTYTQSRGQQ